jgi:hypothetical protein
MDEQVPLTGRLRVPTVTDSERKQKVASPTHFGALRCSSGVIAAVLVWFVLFRMLVFNLKFRDFTAAANLNFESSMISS